MNRVCVEGKLASILSVGRRYLSAEWLTEKKMKKKYKLLVTKVVSHKKLVLFFGAVLIQSGNFGRSYCK